MEEGLDITLDNPVVQCTQMDLGGWSDVNACFIRAVNHVLDHSNFKKDNQVVSQEQSFKQFPNQITNPRTIS